MFYWFLLSVLLVGFLTTLDGLASWLFLPALALPLYILLHQP